MSLFSTSSFRRLSAALVTFPYRGASLCPLWLAFLTFLSFPLALFSSSSHPALSHPSLPLPLPLPLSHLTSPSVAFALNGVWICAMSRFGTQAPRRSHLRRKRGVRWMRSHTHTHTHRHTHTKTNTHLMNFNGMLKDSQVSVQKNKKLYLRICWEYPKHTHTHKHSNAGAQSHSLYLIQHRSEQLSVPYKEWLGMYRTALPYPLNWTLYHCIAANYTCTHTYTHRHEHTTQHARTNTHPRVLVQWIYQDCVLFNPDPKPFKLHAIEYRREGTEKRCPFKTNDP